MALCTLFRSRPRPRQQVLVRRQLACLLIVLTAVVMVVFPSWTTKLLLLRPLATPQKPMVLGVEKILSRRDKNTTTLKNLQFEGRPITLNPPHHRQIQGRPYALAPQQLQMTRNRSNTNGNSNSVMGPYHNWELFSADYEEMLRNLRIFVYPHDVYSSSKAANTSNKNDYDSIFLPLANPAANHKLGNYYSEHAFKVALLNSSLVTNRPEEANFFFMPFSINAMRNHPLLHSASSISDFVAQYTTTISSQFTFWNASAGADHFYVCCHSIGRGAASKHPALHNNAIQVTCSSSYFQRLYITHKDVGLPQVWPRHHHHRQPFNPPAARNILVFFAGRAQNSLIRQRILDLWSNDTSFAISSGGSSLPYEEGFRRSRYCLHVRGYEVNTARVSDAIHYGCIPVIISNYYDLPFASVLDWSEFSIIISEGDISVLKEILLSVSKEKYFKLYKNLSFVRRHFAWHNTPTSYDAFYMTAYQLWLKRGLQRVA